jgi:hypothetical protein
MVAGQNETMPNQPDQLAQAICTLVSRRGGGTICPSDAARAVSPLGWPELMDDARAPAAGRLVDRGEVEITPGGPVVRLATARGPIRLRIAGPASETNVTISGAA